MPTQEYQAFETSPWLSMRNVEWPYILKDCVNELLIDYSITL